MALRPGLFGGLLRGADPSAQPEAAPEPEKVWLGDGSVTPPLEGGRPAFDPVWGTILPSFSAESATSRAAGADESDGTTLIAVSVIGNGFEISGNLRTGRFERLSDWLNMQQGFISVAEGSLFHPGHEERPADGAHGTLWVRLNQVVIVAEHPGSNQPRPNAPRVNKQARRVTVVTPGYTLRGSIHLIAEGSMEQFLESPDPRFLPMTDLVVRWLMDETLVSHHAFALVNRDQIISVLEETAKPDPGVSAEAEAEEPAAAAAEADEPRVPERGAA